MGGKKGAKKNNKQTKKCHCLKRMANEDLQKSLYENTKKQIVHVQS